MDPSKDLTGCCDKCGVTGKNEVDESLCIVCKGYTLLRNHFAKKDLEGVAKWWSALAMWVYNDGYLPPNWNRSKFVEHIDGLLMQAWEWDDAS